MQSCDQKCGDGALFFEAEALSSVAPVASSDPDAAPATLGKGDAGFLYEDMADFMKHYDAAVARVRKRRDGGSHDVGLAGRPCARASTWPRNASDWCLILKAMWKVAYTCYGAFWVLFFIFHAITFLAPKDTWLGRHYFLWTVTFGPLLPWLPTAEVPWRILTCSLAFEFSMFVRIGCVLKMQLIAEDVEQATIWARLAPFSTLAACAAYVIPCTVAVATSDLSLSNAVWLMKVPYRTAGLFFVLAGLASFLDCRGPGAFGALGAGLDSLVGLLFLHFGSMGPCALVQCNSVISLGLLAETTWWLVAAA